MYIFGQAPAEPTAVDNFQKISTEIPKLLRGIDKQLQGN